MMAQGVLAPHARAFGTVLRGPASHRSVNAPFPHVLSATCLGADQYAALADTFPALALFGDHAGRANNAVLRIASSRVLDEAAFPGEWKWFVEHHTSPEFWLQIVDAFGERIRALHPGLEQRVGRPLESWRAVRRGSGAKGDIKLECQLVVNTAVTDRPSSVKAPHVDNACKLWTGLLYLRHRDDDSRGGDLELFDSTDELRFDAHQASRSDVRHAGTLAYAPNSFIGFVNGARSIHSVSAREPTRHIRRYVDFVAEMDDPIFDLAQMGTARRLHFRLFHREASR